VPNFETTLKQNNKKSREKHAETELGALMKINVESAENVNIMQQLRQNAKFTI